MRRLLPFCVFGVLLVFAFGRPDAGADTGHGWPNVPPDFATHSLLGKQMGICQWWIYPNGYIKRCYWPPKKKSGPGAA